MQAERERERERQTDRQTGVASTPHVSMIFGINIFFAPLARKFLVLEAGHHALPPWQPGISIGKNKIYTSLAGFSLFALINVSRSLA